MTQAAPAIALLNAIALLDSNAVAAPDADAVHSISDALVNGWSFPLVPFIGLALALAIYLRGWLKIRKTRARQLPNWRAACFVAGVVAMWMALASPIDALDEHAAHGAHAATLHSHVGCAAADDSWESGRSHVARAAALFRARRNRKLLRQRWFHAIAHFVTHPMLIWLAMNVAYLGWHIPAMFELTFTSERIHDFEHLCFFVTSLAYWWVVLAPWPARSRWPRWTVIPYLLSSDILNTVLSASLVFAGKVLYPSYAAAERVTSMTPLQDQAAAGAGCGCELDRLSPSRGGDNDATACAEARAACRPTLSHPSVQKSYAGDPVAPERRRKDGARGRMLTQR